MNILVVGCGLTGSAITRCLVAAGFSVTVFDANTRRAKRLADEVSGVVAVADIEQIQSDQVVLATPVLTHVALAKSFLEKGFHVISLSDNLSEVQALFDFDKLAHTHDRSLVIAGLTPGLSCLLARLGVSKLDTAKSIVVSKAGTAGPACARSHHQALKGKALNWYDGQWENTQSGTGRLLHWFPDPIGPRDCYRGSLPSPYLLRKSFPDVNRISARIAANRRDRLTSRLPMLRPPHIDGGPAAVRVEVSGSNSQAIANVVYGASGSPSQISAEVVCTVANFIAEGDAPVGYGGLASWPNWKDLFAAMLDAGVVVQRF